MENEAPESIILKVLVAKEANKIIFAESGSDFIDVLLSFMVTPIGSIVRLTRDSKGNIGCLNSLYASAENLDEQFLQSKAYRDILLHPRTEAELYCTGLKVKLNENVRLHACSKGSCRMVSCYKNGSCWCGGDISRILRVLDPDPQSPEEGVFMKTTLRFMITDDLQVVPLSTMTGLSLLSELGDYGKIEERTISIGKDEVLKLLKCASTSRTPLSDTFLDKPAKKSGNKFNVCEVNYGPRSMCLGSSKNEKRICFKLIANKAENKALYAEVKEDFVSLIFSFLTFPLGYIFNQFPRLSLKGCLGNLYKSIEDIEAGFFSTEEMKKMLIDPKLPPGLAYGDDHLIGIQEATTLLYRSRAKRVVKESHSTVERFIKGPSKFMVMDNLAVMPLSPMSGISLINYLEVPFGDVWEQEITMGEDEALRLLASSLASKRALTNTFLQKEHPMTECFDFLQHIWQKINRRETKISPEDMKADL